MLNRGIDHLVLSTRDLERQRDLYRRLGFTLTPKAQHPFGTANSIIQLQGCFLELLTVADESLITEPTGDEFSFGAFNRDFLSIYEGFSMLVFEGRDARADRAEFAKSNLTTYAPFDFERTARQPDGSEVTVGFSLAFVTHADMPHFAFFTCQQHAPEYFWKPEYQKHANTAQTIADAVMVADRPTDYARFFERLQGTGAVAIADGNITVQTARGTVTVLTPDSWRARFRFVAPPNLNKGPRFAAYTISVSDMNALRTVLNTSGLDIKTAGDRMIVKPRDAFGVLIEFTPVAG